MTEAGGAVLGAHQRRGSGDARCPACGRASMDVFFQQHGVPVTSNVSFRTREEALAAPRGDMRLAFCHACGLIANVAFEEQPPGEEIETSQAASPRFQEYASGLARSWVDRYGLHGATVLEIGCARGEFLATMLAAGAGHAIGVDPVLSGPDAPAEPEGMSFVGDVFRAEHLDGSVRAIVCRHTLEHLYESGGFLVSLRAAIGERDIVVLFEVPDVARVLRNAAFQDIYYEHCSYFSAGSLGRLFRRAGFEVLRLDRTYDDQYLVIEARPGTVAPVNAAEGGVDDRSELWQGTRALRAGYARRIDRMERLLGHAAARGERAVFWGAGSKATAFLTALPNRDVVAGVVDINPRKWGTYIAGTGHEVIAPERLNALRPDLVVLMNPAYRDEVGRMLEALGVAARLIGPDGDE
ncbi:MAG: class I SAM-dependent methyltransferase [Dehalococcoidia bacterium]